MNGHLVAVLLLVGTGCAAGPAEVLQAGGDLPVSVAVEVSAPKNGDPNVTITARLTNLGSEPLNLQVRCSVIEIDQDQAGTWQRLGDLRLCAPRSQETLPAGARLTTTDARSLSPGTDRVVIEGSDGRTALSDPFIVPALRQPAGPAALSSRHGSVEWRSPGESRSVTGGHWRAGPGLLACLLVGALPLAGQPVGTLGLGASWVAFDGFLASGAVVFAPSLQFDSPRVSVLGQAGWTRFESGRGVFQADATAGWLVGSEHWWRLELSGSAGASRYASAPGSGHLLAGARFHVFGAQTRMDRPGGRAELRRYRARGPGGVRHGGVAR